MTFSSLEGWVVAYSKADLAGCGSPPQLPLHFTQVPASYFHCLLLFLKCMQLNKYQSLNYWKKR